MSAPRRQLLRRLGRQIAAEQDAELATSEERATQAATRAVATHAAARVAARSSSTARPGATRTLFALAATGALAAAICVLAFWSYARPLSVALAGGAHLAVDDTAGAPDHSVALHFSDRSEIALAPGARIRLLELTRRGATLRLETGSARVHVSPGRGGEWTLQAGGFAVHVTGTRFVIAYSAHDQALALDMLEGSVQVTGCTLGAAQALSAGQSFRASCAAGAAVAHAPLVAKTTAAAAPASRTGDANQARAVAPAQASKSVHERRHGRSRHAHSGKAAASGERDEAITTSWQQLARAGKFRAAYTLGRDIEVATLRVADALLLGDAARLSGETTAAQHIYVRVRSLHAGSDAAAAAAFACGRLQFDQRAAFSEAARWFEVYLRERETGALAREARGRLVEALARSGQRAAATRAAKNYLRSYPAGPHATFARGVLQGE